MKAICRSSGGFRGIIRDEEMFEDYVNGKIDWSPNTKRKMESVSIPFTTFEYLVELHKEGLTRTSGISKDELLNNEEPDVVTMTCCRCYQNSRTNPNLKFYLVVNSKSRIADYICENCSNKEEKK